jgi:predicted nucleic acid-binding protein
VILVDTSVWVDHFRGAERAAGLQDLLEENEVLMHPWVIGELALGGLGPRGAGIVADLGQLPPAPRISDGEILDLIAARRLYGRGIGWVDAQLLGSALVGGGGLWTFDGRLERVAADLGVMGKR